MSASSRFVAAVWAGGVPALDGIPFTSVLPACGGGRLPLGVGLRLRGGEPPNAEGTRVVLIPVLDPGLDVGKPPVGEYGGAGDLIRDDPGDGERCARSAASACSSSPARACRVVASAEIPSRPVCRCRFGWLAPPPSVRTGGPGTLTVILTCGSGTRWL